MIRRRRHHATMFAACAIVLFHHGLVSVDALVPPESTQSDLNRRRALGGIASLATGMIGLGLVPQASLAESQIPQLAAPPLSPSSSSSSYSSSTSVITKQVPNFAAYNIIPDESAVRSKLDKIDSKAFLNSLASPKAGGSIWLGEHHNSAPDHDFQANFIQGIHQERKRRNVHHPMAIGLEQVQNQFQPILDDYVAGKVSLDHMRFMVQWDKRWTWNFENYMRIFETAKELNIRLVALNVDSEDLSLVEKEGYPGLPKDRLRKYIKDPVGFAEFAKAKEFSTYVDYVIQPSFELHQRLGLLRYTMAGEEMESEMSFRRFLSGRILWDEGMASQAFSWCKDNPGGLLVGLVGADHVKFKNGIPGRFSRMAEKLMDCTTVVINPTLIDSRPSGSVSSIPGSDSAQYPDRITLQLRYARDGTEVNPVTGLPFLNKGGVLPFSDYVVVT